MTRDWLRVGEVGVAPIVPKCPSWLMFLRLVKKEISRYEVGLEKSELQRRRGEVYLCLCEEKETLKSEVRSQKSSESREREEWCGVEIELLRSPM